MKRNMTAFLFETKSEEWRLLSFYQRFEQVVAVTVTIVISIVVMLALMALIKEAATLLLSLGKAPLGQIPFKSLFGTIMTVLIAMEFKHSIIKVAGRKESIVQVKTVILIALMAMTRKLIILEPGQIQPFSLVALSVAILALGIVYWLVREQDSEKRFQISAGSSRGRTRHKRRAFPGPRSLQGENTSKHTRAAVGNGFESPGGICPPKTTRSASNPGLCPTSKTLRFSSGQSRSTSSKSATSAS